MIRSRLCWNVFGGQPICEKLPTGIIQVTGWIPDWGWSHFHYWLSESVVPLGLPGNIQAARSNSLVSGWNTGRRRWGKTGIVGRPVKVTEDIGWVVGEWEAKTWMDSRMVSQWPACLRTFESCPWSWLLSELVETQTPNLNCCKGLTGRLPPMLSCPGRVTQRCDTLYWLVNMSTRGFPKTQNRLFKVSCGSRHSVGLGLFILDNASAVTLRDPGKWVWD